MAVPYDTSVLLTAVKRRAYRPAADSAFTDADILAIADEETIAYIVPLITRLRQEFFVSSVDLAIPTGSNPVVNIPARAAGQEVRDVLLVDSAGNILSLAKIELDQVSRFGGPVQYGIQGFYLKNNHLVLLGNNTTWTALRVFYYQSPSKLESLSTSTQGRVSALDTSTGIVTLTTTKPSTFTTSSPLDFISASPGFSCLAIDQTPTAASGSALTFSSLPTGLAVGDYISLAGYSPIPQIPIAAMPLLYQRVAVMLLEIVGENGQLERARSILKEMASGAEAMLSNRSPGEGMKCVNVNGIGGVRNTNGGWPSGRLGGF